jgi:hypothetical protein
MIHVQILDKEQRTTVRQIEVRKSNFDSLSILTVKSLIYILVFPK